MVVEGIQVVTAGLSTVNLGSDLLGALHNHLSLDWLVLAQDVSNVNILNDMQKAWGNFVQTGQIWALLIGIAIGYFLRGFTSF
jgi:predicted GNAT family acetyltransferase